MKKLISMLMAGAMILALAVPALADTLPVVDAGATASDKVTQSTTVKGATEVPDIKLFMPAVASTSAIVVNPYGLTVKKIGASELTNGLTNQILAPTYVIASKTNATLEVTADVTTTLGGNMKLAGAKLDTAKNTTKTNTAWVEIIAKPYAEAADASKPTDVLSDSTTGTIKVTLKAGAVKVQGDDTTPLRLAKCTDTSAKSSWLAFGFDGDAASSPTTAWTNKDTISVAIAWTFTPITLTA